METEDHGAEPSGRPSKSQLKRETALLHQLTDQLVALPPAMLVKLQLDGSLHEAVSMAGKMKRAALRRQKLYIVGLMRDRDTAQISRQLAELTQPQRQAVAAFQQVERWRDRLLTGDELLLNELVSRHGVDRQHVNQLLRNARKEQAQGKPPKSARALFRYLNELADNA